MPYQVFSNVLARSSSLQREVATSMGSGALSTIDPTEVDLIIRQNLKNHFSGLLKSLKIPSPLRTVSPASDDTAISLVMIATSSRAPIDGR